MSLVFRQTSLSFVHGSKGFQKNASLEPPYDDVADNDYPIAVFGECDGNPNPWSFVMTSFSDEGDADSDPTELDFECNFQITSQEGARNCVLDDGDGFHIRLNGEWHDEEVEGPEDFLKALHKAFPNLSEAQCVILRDWSECPDDQEMLEETYSNYATDLLGDEVEIVTETQEGKSVMVIPSDTYASINPDSLVLCDVHYFYQDPADDTEYEIGPVIREDIHPGFDDSGYEQYHRIFWFAAR